MKRALINKTYKHQKIKNEMSSYKITPEDEELVRRTLKPGDLETAVVKEKKIILDSKKDYIIRKIIGRAGEFGYLVVEYVQADGKKETHYVGFPKEYTPLIIPVPKRKFSRKKVRSSLKNCLSNSILEKMPETGREVFDHRKRKYIVYRQTTAQRKKFVAEEDGVIVCRASNIYSFIKKLKSIMALDIPSVPTIKKKTREKKR